MLFILLYCRMEPILKAYVYEAIEVEKAGLKANFKKNTASYFLKNPKQT